MTEEKSVLEWMEEEFLRQWKDFIVISRDFNAQRQIPYNKRKVIFPFLPTEADGYTLRTFIAFFIKFLFKVNPNAFILISNESGDAIIWAAFQKVESYSIAELIELIDYLPELSPVLSLETNQARLNFLHEFLKKQGISSVLGFYLQLSIKAVSDFKGIYKLCNNLLEFYSKIWDWLSIHFKNQTIQFYPEPLFFEFLKKLTKSITLNALEFKQIFGNLLPSQNLMITFLDKDVASSLALITQPNQLQIQFLDYDLLQSSITKFEETREKGLEYFNKLLKNKVTLLIDHQKVKPTASITYIEDFWKVIENIMIQYSFENVIDRYFELTKEVEEKWTIEREIVLLRRWGKSFMGFQFQKLIPTQFSSIITSILRFLNEDQTQTVWFIVNDALELVYILEIDYKRGLFRRIYMIPDRNLFELFNSEPDKELGVKKAHFYFASQGKWVHQIIVITAQDLNQLVTVLPLLTTIKGSVKYLNMIENIINYRMFFYPPNFFADLIGRKGATYFFKNIIFPMLLEKTS
jgi:hypothetical protein